MQVIIRSRWVGAPFVHPLDPAPKTAILVRGFRHTRSIRVFAEGWSDKARRFKPAVIAATYQQLCEIAHEGVALTHAVICLCWNFDDLLNAGQREFLWRSFGVPVFEQVLGKGNVTLANECEAHAGLHITPAGSERSRGSARCNCGRLSAPAIRIDYGEPERSHAAAAG